MIFEDLGGLKLPDICVTGEEKPRKNLTQETCPDQGLNPGPLCDRRTCYRLAHSGGNQFAIQWIWPWGCWIFFFFLHCKVNPAKYILVGGFFFSHLELWILVLHSESVQLKYEWERGLFLSCYMCLKWLNGRTPVHKTGCLRFKSLLRDKFFSQYLSYTSYACVIIHIKIILKKIYCFIW